MKTVYFVRHGESEANVGAATFMGETSKLTERGREQAAFIAKRSARLKFDALLCSTAIRAKETAEYIQKETGKEPEVVEIFTERKLPDELLGKPRDVPETEKMHKDWTDTFYQDDLRVGNGDNFSIFKSRVLQALDYLKARDEVSLLVVTHGFFLHMAASLVLLGEELTAAEFKKMAPALWMKNTGLTMFEYRMKDEKRLDNIRREGWVIQVLNDHAHLG